MRPEQVDWKSGEIVFWDLGFLILHEPLFDQIGDLKEDLAQVKYGNCVLDVGWYPEFSVEGNFVVRVVCGTNWDEPLFQESSATVEGLLSCLEIGIAVAKAHRL